MTRFLKDQPIMALNVFLGAQRLYQSGNSVDCSRVIILGNSSCLVYSLISYFVANPYLELTNWKEMIILIEIRVLERRAKGETMKDFGYDGEECICRACVGHYS